LKQLKNSKYKIRLTADLQYKLVDILN